MNCFRFYCLCSFIVRLYIIQALVVWNTLNIEWAKALGLMMNILSSLEWVNKYLISRDYLWKLQRVYR